MLEDNSANVTVLGIPAETGRWLLIPLGMIILLCLGNLYTWSVFRKPLEDELGITATQSLLPYTVSLIFYALLMPIAGFYIPRLGLRPIAALGGIIVGLGYTLSSLASNVEMMILTYGVLTGTGVGIAYGVPMAVVARWFPDKRGLAVGLTIIGFGLSPLLTAPLANRLIAAYGMQPTLRILGIAFMIIILAIATLLKPPPKDWQPRQTSTSGASAQALNYPPPNLKKSGFLWIMDLLCDRESGGLECHRNFQFCGARSD